MGIKIDILFNLINAQITSICSVSLMTLHPFLSISNFDMCNAFSMVIFYEATTLKDREVHSNTPSHEIRLSI